MGNLRGEEVKEKKSVGRKCPLTGTEGEGQ